MNVGDEEDGKNQLFDRPVLILKKFNQNLFYALPMTTKNKDNRYYHQIEFHGKIVSLMFSQLRVLDKKRLWNKVGILTQDDFEKVKGKLRKML